MLPPRKYLIPNQDITRIITQQDTTFPPLLENFPTGHKPFLIIHIVEIKHNNNITILQIIHIPRTKII